MNIEATEKNVKWLLDALFQARRNLQWDEVDHPVFVLLTKGQDDRDKVEDILFTYACNKYGIEQTKLRAGARNSTTTRIGLGEVGCSIMLVDI